MIEITTRADSASAANRPIAQLELPFELRQKSRQRARLASGEEAALMLPRGTLLRGGDLLLASDGRIVKVIASCELVLHVECASPEALARAAYHLGNRHVPVEVGSGYLRLAADHVLEEMLKGLGAVTTAVQAPFEPEAGAYAAHGHGLSFQRLPHHDHPDQSHHEDGHGGRIHEYGRERGPQ